MSQDQSPSTSRRQFLKATGGVAAATALSGFGFPAVHTESSGTIKVALVGCGGRGGGAAVNALSTTSGPIQLVAMADAFADRLNGCYNNLKPSMGAKMDVPEDRRFVGYDAYRKAMDCLSPGDVVILTTPPAFRWVHFKQAIDKRLNVFMEKPVTVDGPTSRRMLLLADESIKANLKVGVGLMSRHARNLQELAKRIRNGELGEIVLMRGYRMHGPAGYSESLPKPGDVSDLEYQIRRFHSFLWASGGCFSDFYIHIIDHLAWMKNAWPISAQASGGRHYQTNGDGVPFVDQNLDTYSVEYTFGDGTKFYFDGRCQNGTHGKYSSYVHGTKGVAVASRANDCGGPSAIYRGHNMDDGKVLWQSTDSSNPYQNEWDALIDAIRNDRPFNEVKRGVDASLVTSMGRMAAHTGQVITYQQMLNCEHEFAPFLESLPEDPRAPLTPGSDGRYPAPQPGMKPNREY
ncbi:MAG TPA: twin-arginine translocation signal domain-containing protein [Fimbriimonadaceae bacterium]|nr:twin-arginine translocation signal domain-containing protein [Fimbriimonadaceae bacterium]